MVVDKEKQELRVNSRQDWNKNSDYVKAQVKKQNAKNAEIVKPGMDFAKTIKNSERGEKILNKKKDKVKKWNVEDYKHDKGYFVRKEARLKAAKAEKESTIDAVADKLVSKSTSSSSEDKKELRVITQAKAKEEAADSIVKKLGKGFKATGGKIVSIYSGKEGRGKQVAAIAVAASALAASVGAAAYIKAKKKAKEAEKKNEK